MFKKPLPALAATILVAACGQPTIDVGSVAQAPSNGGPVVFAQRQISAESGDCADNGPHCATVQIDTLQTTGGGSAVVRENIDLYLQHDLVGRMRGFLPEETGRRVNTLDALAAEFLAQQRAFVADFPESPARWSIEIAAKAVYATEAVATIDISEFAYTGGAHPNTRRRLVSFDAESGQLLGVDDLTADVDGLTSTVENRLRADRGLDPDVNLEVAGFWLPEGGFTLPDNMGIVADGVLFHWDAYEIAPYAMGPIDVTIPASEITGIISQPYW